MRLTRRRRCMEDKDEGHGDSNNVINGDQSTKCMNIQMSFSSFHFCFAKFLTLNFSYLFNGRCNWLSSCLFLTLITFTTLQKPISYIIRLTKFPAVNIRLLVINRSTYFIIFYIFPTVRIIQLFSASSESLSASYSMGFTGATIKV